MNGEISEAIEFNSTNHSIIRRRFKDDGSTLLDGLRFNVYKGIQVYAHENTGEVAHISNDGANFNVDVEVNGDIRANDVILT
jgi:hypothetical protein